MQLLFFGWVIRQQNGEAEDAVIRFNLKVAIILLADVGNRLNTEAMVGFILFAGKREAISTEPKVLAPKRVLADDGGEALNMMDLQGYGAFILR